MGKKLECAASSAITILNNLYVTFSGWQLQGIHIRGAILEGGNFHQTNFNGADLTEVRMSRCYIAEADFSNCILKDFEIQATSKILLKTPITRDDMKYGDKNIPMDSSFILIQKRERVLLIGMEHLKEFVIEYLESPKCKITCFSFHPTSKELVIGDSQGNLSKWKYDDKNCKFCDFLFGHNYAISNVAFQPTQGKYLVSLGNRFGDILLWNMTQPAPESISLEESRGTLSIIWRPNSDNLLLSMQQDKVNQSKRNITLWDIEETYLSKKSCILLRYKFKCDDSFCSFTPDGTMLVLIKLTQTLSETDQKLQQILIWDLSKYDLKQTKKFTPTYKKKIIVRGNPTITSIGFAPRGCTLALGYSTGTIKIFRVDNVIKYKKFENVKSKQDTPVISLAFSPDNYLLCTQKNRVTYLDINKDDTSNNLFDIPDLLDCFYCGDKFIIISSNCIQHDDLRKMIEVNRRNATHTSQINEICIAHGFLCTLSEDIIVLWRIENGKIITSWEHKEEPFSKEAIVTEPNGTKITIIISKNANEHLTLNFPDKNNESEIFRAESQSSISTENYLVTHKSTKYTFKSTRDKPYKLVIYEGTKLKQNIYFAYPVNRIESDRDGNYIIVSTINLVTCWKYSNDKYQLLWDDGDVLICAKSIFKGVTDISELNKKELEQNGSYVSLNDPLKIHSSTTITNQNTTVTSAEVTSGIYKVSGSDDIYHIKVFNGSFSWYSEPTNSKTGNNTRTLGTGMIDGKCILVSWNELPPGNENGTVSLLVNDDHSLTVIGGNRFTMGTLLNCVSHTEKKDDSLYTGRKSDKNKVEQRSKTIISPDKTKLTQSIQYEEENIPIYSIGD